MKSAFLTVALAIVLIWHTQCAFGQVQIGAAGLMGGAGITVTGAGDVGAKPDIVEINVRVVGTAELTDDAIIKQRDARDRVQKAFDGLKVPNLMVEEQNLNVRSGNSKDAAQMIMRGMPANSNTPAQVEVASTLRVRVSKVSEMSSADLMKLVGKLLDTAKDSGAMVGSSDEEVAMAYRYGRTVANSIVRFVVSDADRLREEAYKKAAADARARAERLAKLHEVKLGPVQSVQETQTSADEISQRQQPGEVYADASVAKPNEITAESMSGGTYRVRLSVRFAIETTDRASTAQTSAAQTRKSTE